MVQTGCKKDLEEEERLVAVLVTENFNDNFQPLIQSQPLALISLVNTPLLDYSLDWLQRNEIDETIIYCGAHPHSDKIREHCRKWSMRYGNSMKINLISSENCSSLGDAMRDLDSKSILKKDFILMTGALVGNLDLKGLLKKHKVSCKKDPHCVMSCIYLKNQIADRKLDSSRTANLIMNSRTGKIFSHARPEKSTKVLLSTEIIQSASKLKVLPQLEDPSIAICSQMIPPLFSDNFDYGTRDSLVQGIIEQEELLGCTIHAQLIDEGYAAVVSSFRAYEEISMDVMKRKAFPSVPERSLSSQRIRYWFQPSSGSYWDSSAKFDKKSLGERVVVDAGTVIDSRCRIKNSVVGKHCVIKENVTIHNSFLGSNVIVNKGCILDTCYIGDDVRLLAGVHVEPGSILCSGIVLGPNLKVNRCTRLVSDVMGPEGRQQERNPLVCGNEGQAFEYAPDEEDICGVTSPWGRDGAAEEGVEESEEATSGESEEEEEIADGEEEVSSDEEREQEFEKEVKDSLLNAFRKKSVLENVVLEVNSSRHAYNVTMENVLATVTKACLHVVEEDCGSCLVGEKLWHSVKRGLQEFAELIKNYIKKPRDQMIVLKVLEETANEEERYLPAFQHILYEMSQKLDILDEEVIVYWYRRKGFQSKAFPRIAESIKKFVEWIEENEDKESESDED